MLAPIVVFAFNRPMEFKRLIESLRENKEAEESEIYIFIDGARQNMNGEKEKVQEVYDIASGIHGFRSVHVIKSDINQGLGPSIINGVSNIISKYGSAIVLEDDLVVLPNFLKFMNESLSRYRENDDVWSICGYTNKVKVPKEYFDDAYFCTRSSSWGWATWKDRWESVDWTFKMWDDWKLLKSSFNKWGGSDCFSMLERCKEGRNKSWAIRFCFNQFLRNKLSLFPIKSLVINNGFNGNGTNCKTYSRFKYELMDGGKTDFIFPSKIYLDDHLYKQSMRYHTIGIRIWSKLMYMIK